MKKKDRIVVVFGKPKNGHILPRASPMNTKQCQGVRHVRSWWISKDLKV